MKSTMSVQDLADLTEMLTASKCTQNPVWKFSISGRSASTVQDIYVCPAPTSTEAEAARPWTLHGVLRESITS
jgi:hypothetical protein